MGRTKTAVDNDSNRPVDMLDVPLDEHGVGGNNPPSCAQDEVKLVRLLLARAPAERAWHRRSWLVLLRARSQCSKAIRARQDHGGPARGTCGERGGWENGDGGGELGQSQHGAGEPSDAGSGKREWRWWGRPGPRDLVERCDDGHACRSGIGGHLSDCRRVSVTAGDVVRPARLFDYLASEIPSVGRQAPHTRGPFEVEFVFHDVGEVLVL